MVQVSIFWVQENLRGTPVKVVILLLLANLS